MLHCQVLSLLALLLAPAVFSLPTSGNGRIQGTQLGARSERSSKNYHESKLEDMVAEASSITEVELSTGDDDGSDESDEVGAGDTKGASQHFFPSFAPLFAGTPLANARPQFDEQPRGFGESSSFRSVYPSEDSERVLGSGNFGIIRGGTYYGGSQDETEDLDTVYYRGNNGHGRPPFYRANPQPAYRNGGDFFAGFRDFADITTPPKSAYSQYYVVYANKNSTAGHPGVGPKNIIEQLALLDAPKKVSKKKQKLQVYKEKVSYTEAKKKKGKSLKEIHDEPLLALS